MTTMQNNTMLSLSDHSMHLIRKKAALLPRTMRGHFLEMVAARIGPEPSDATVEEVARTIHDAIRAIS